MNVYVVLGVAVVAEVIATAALKASAGFSKLVPSVVVVLGYAVAFTALSLTLKTIPLGIAYAIWAGAGVALVSVAGWLYFKQPLDIAAILGISLIVTGVLVINLFSKTSAH